MVCRAASALAALVAAQQEYDAAMAELSDDERDAQLDEEERSDAGMDFAPDSRFDVERNWMGEPC